MRIERLDLTAYGCFSDQSLNLSEGSSGLHLIYGDNEAGKSTSLRALIAWLFGIPPNTNDNYLHGNPQLRIGGKLSLSSGEEIEFVRRKGRKGTLLEPYTDLTLDDSILSPFLPIAMDEPLFKQLYGIDHLRLVEGGQDLLNESGDLGQALFSAAVGTADLRKLLIELQDNAKELFTPQGRKQYVNSAISSYKEAQKRVRDSSLPVAEWKSLQEELTAILATIEQLESHITEKSKEKSRLGRLNRVNGALAERRAVITRIEAVGKVLLLPKDFDENCKTSKHKLQTGTEEKERSKAKLATLKEESERLNIRNELLDNEEAILAIYKELGGVEKTIQDRPQQDGIRCLLRNEAELLLKGVGTDIGFDDADGLRPLLNNKKWIAGLAQEYDLLSQRKKTIETTLRGVKSDQKSYQTQLAEETQSTLVLHELKAAVAVARKAGDLEQRLADLEKQASDNRTACEKEFVRLGRFSQNIEVLSKIAMPVAETLDIFEKHFDALSEKIKAYEDKKKDLEKEKNQAEYDLKGLLLTTSVPTMLELKEARTARNAGWHLIKCKYIEKTNVEKDITAFADNADLPTFYEKTIAEADHVSDQLRLASDQVAKRVNFEAKIENLVSRLSDITEEYKKTNDVKKAYQKQWHAIWQPLRIDAGTPREMKQWIFRVDKLLTNVHVANSTSGEARELAKACEDLKQLVSLQIATFDHSACQQDMSLEAMINLCEQRIEREEADLERKRQLKHSLDDAEIRIKESREELTSIENDQSDWTEEWGKAINGLGLKPDAHPEQATEAFDKLLQFFEAFDKSEKLRKQIFGMDQVAKRFEKKVVEFTDGIGFKRENNTTNSIAAQLHRELNEAREARASLKNIETQEKEMKMAVEKANISIQMAEGQLVSLREQAGVEDDDGLEVAGESSREKRELQQKLDRLEQELTRNGDGLSIHGLEKEADESDTDAIEGELAQVNLKLKSLQADRDTHRDKRQTLQDEIKTKDGNAAAANASEEVEQYRARVASGVEQYLRLKIAALILEQRIEDYRKKNQAPILARAGELFSQLTLQSYANLRDDLNEKGKPILLGVRPDNKEVPVDGMSDGTRDQLYLSLRIATLEQHLSRGEPMPFIVDDILIGFDDHRTKVCLEVLADLAADTQVLLFTHHRRVLDLAATVASKTGVFTHELV